MFIYALNMTVKRVNPHDGNTGNLATTQQALNSNAFRVCNQSVVYSNNVILTSILLL